MRKISKTFLFLLLATLLVGSVQSCSKRKCDGNRRTKVPMGYM